MPSRSLQDADPKLRSAFLALAAEFKVAAPGRELVITCTHRSPEEQWQLYREGRNEAGQIEDISKVVTQLSGKPGHESLHNVKPARALDVAIAVGGKVTWDFREYLPLGALAAKHGLEWGGDWHSFKDYPHLQLPKGA